MALNTAGPENGTVHTRRNVKDGLTVFLDVAGKENGAQADVYG